MTRKNISDPSELLLSVNLAREIRSWDEIDWFHCFHFSFPISEEADCPTNISFHSSILADIQGRPSRCPLSVVVSIPERELAKDMLIKKEE